MQDLVIGELLRGCNWGIAEGLVYENFIEKEFDYKEIAKRENIKSIFGLDFGYTNDPTAALTNFEIYNEIMKMGYSKEIIRADSAEPKSISELRELGLSRIRATRKGRNSINNGIQFIQGFKIIIHPRCVNFLTEITNYTWDKDKCGKFINKPIDEFNHLLDAMRYAMEEIGHSELFSFE